MRDNERSREREDAQLNVARLDRRRATEEGRPEDVAHLAVAVGRRERLRDLEVELALVEDAELQGEEASRPARALEGGREERRDARGRR